jgi:hypothetical protein
VQHPGEPDLRTTSIARFAGCLVPRGDGRLPLWHIPIEMALRPGILFNWITGHRRPQHKAYETVSEDLTIGQLIKQSWQQAAFDIEFGQDLSPRLLIVTCLSINWWLKHARPTPTF